MTSRRLEVGADRLMRWVAGFGERHGFAAVSAVEPDRIEITAADAARVVLHVPFPPLVLGGEAAALTPGAAAEALVQNASAERDLAVLLIRRGGYGVAALAGGRVTASKVGSRYVQGRTAAGGWSQQRFARRRDGQVHGLLVSAGDVAVRLLTPVTAQALVTGGDRELVERLLADPRLAAVRKLPRGPHLDVGDPRNDDIKALPASVRQVRLTLDEPG